MNTHHYRTGGKRWRSELDVQYINGILSQLGAESKRDANEWCVRASLPNYEIGPALRKSSDCFGTGNVKRVLIN